MAENVDTTESGKKRRNTPLKWKRNATKKARVSGEEYTDSEGTHHPARVQTLVNLQMSVHLTSYNCS
ncbi:hypothetical protein RRG08_039111 [Elysia crispata]|uniref:Uncharacterized protein n=1 Tax=Elysia crispata TaxID=231223 RepID=A0AAE1BDA9_9GAST|nr:hypothetical protein RRG08_039111 [Elysia crispata]